MLIQGNCIEKIKELEDSSVDLIYLDPPFFTQKVHMLKTRDNLQEYIVEDKWNSISDYLLFMRDCLDECRRVLKETGSIFLHCDKSASHYLRVILDETFGHENFQSEIIWSYRRWSNSSRGLLNSHQNIYFYSKTNRFKFNTIYTDYSPTTNVDQILQQRERNEHGKSIYKRDSSGKIIIGQEKKGVPLGDVWAIPYLNPKAKERVGYPTQKPVLLLEQIIKIASDEGDLVFDPFCGSGTSLVAAKLLNRKFLGIDISDEAIKLANNRLEEMIVSKSFLLEKGEDEYKNRSETELKILADIDAIPVQRNSGIDGFLKQNFLGAPVSIRIQRDNEPLEEAIRKLKKYSKTKHCKHMIVFRTNILTGLSLEYNTEIDDSILIIDCYDLILNNWLRTKEDMVKLNYSQQALNRA